MQDNIKPFQDKLLAWYRSNNRQALPWRKKKSPYTTFVSEAMLQQTQVETVLPYYKRFLKRFPTLKALGEADVHDVLELWSGLGYYTRARNLHKAAGQIINEHGGKIPQEVDQLLKLAGVGPYSAGAIASIAFDKPVPLVDGNVARVLARLYGIKANLQDPSATQQFWKAAGQLVPKETAGDFNQALMDLGALICTAKNPSCLICPVSRTCWAFANLQTNTIPPPRKPTPKKKLRYLCGWIERKGEVLLARRPLKGLWSGLWELPGGEANGKNPEKEQLASLLKERVGLSAEGKERLETQHQILTHRQLEIRAFKTRLKQTGRPRLFYYSDVRWIKKEKLELMALTAGMRKLIEKILGPST